MFLKDRALPIIFSALLVVFMAVPVAAKKANDSVKFKTDCGKTALEKSECMIKAILENVKITYTHVGGGGITEIKSIATNVYRVSITQEERVDTITYEFGLKPNGELHISKRSIGAETMGR